MSRTQTFSSIDTDDGNHGVIHKTPIDYRTRLRNFFGLPKPIEHDDDASCKSYRFLTVSSSLEIFRLAFLTLLCATSFIEDAVFYKSIVHRVSKTYLYIYRWYSSPLVQRFVLSIDGFGIVFVLHGYGVDCIV